MYKEVKVVALRTQDDNPVRVPFIKYKGVFIRDLAGGEFRRYLKQGGLPYHLYLVSDDKIKEGDWYINRANKKDYLNRSGKDRFEGLYNDCYKVIATTDQTLRIRSTREDKIVNPGVYEKPLPKIPESFICSFLKNQFTTTLVEYDCIASARMGTFDFSKDPIEIDSYLSKCIEYVIKLKDNEVIIKSSKDSWSREELDPILEEVMSLGVQAAKYKKVTESYTNILENWKEENL